MKNIDMFQNCAYREQLEFDPATANHCYQLLPSDFSSLYRKHNRQNGIDIEFAPEYNLDNWLNSKHPDYKPALHQAVFYYCSRSARNERLKVCISTKEMDMSAWKYGHKSQIILDGTFGVCSTRLLLFIIMGVDEKRQGVPLAMLLFSAPTGDAQGLCLASLSPLFYFSILKTRARARDNLTSLSFLFFSLSFPTIYFNIGCPQLYDIITTDCAAIARLLRRAKPAGGFRKCSRYF